MSIIASITKPVHRHRQDTGISCGRACAQMIISSLSQAGAAANTPIAVAQETLRTRETNPIDIELWWYTEPDELRGLLASAPELAPADKDWRIASYASHYKLLADLTLSMQTHRRPAAVTIGANEHWVVLKEVQQVGTHQVFVFVNPMPSDLVHIQAPNPAFQHHYQDPDCGLNQSMLIVNTGNELGDLKLKIQGFTRPSQIKVLSPAGEVAPGIKLPPASNVSTYTNKAVGVRFGPKPPVADINALAQQLIDSRLSAARVMSSNPVEAVRANLQSQFRVLTDTFTITSVQQVLTAPDLGIVGVRMIRDMQNPNLSYVLASGYSQQAKTGFIAAFDSSVQGELLHLQLTNDHALLKSITQAPAETLYWTSAQTSHFPPMAMPYYVFRQKPGQPGTLVRLYDNAEGEVVVAEPGHADI